jgi:hypothetical protein
MAQIYGPHIVTDGLVLAWNAADRNSYPGSGTTLTDISANNKTGTLTNSPVFVDNGGNSYFTNFVTNEYIVASNSYTGTSIPTGASPRTIMVGFRTPSSLTGYQHIIHYGTNSTDQAYGLAIYENKFNNHTWAGNSNYSNQTLSTSTDYIGAVKYNDSASPRNTFFLNGTFGITGYGQGKTGDYSINTGTAYQFQLGMRIATGEYLGSGGRIYFALVYNRELSNQEILQNYTVQKSRFNL